MIERSDEIASSAPQPAAAQPRLRSRPLGAELFGIRLGRESEAMSSRKPSRSILPGSVVL